MSFILCLCLCRVSFEVVVDEAECIIPLISDWLELDASDEWVRHDAEIVSHTPFPHTRYVRNGCYHALAILTNPSPLSLHQALQQELAFASYLNAQCVILPPPSNRTQVGSFARAINACLSSVAFMEFSVRVPIYDAVTVVQVPSRSPSPVPSPIEPTSRFSPASAETAGAPPESNMTTWEMWDTIRTICGYNPRLTLSAFGFVPAEKPEVTEMVWNSFGFDPTVTAIVDCSQPVACGACAASLVTCVNFHCQCERIPRSAERDSVLHPGHHEGVYQRGRSAEAC